MTDLRFEIYIAGTPEQVWDVLVKPDFVRQIYFGSVIESEFKIGSDLAYIGPGKGGPATVHIFGKILEWEPAKIFTHSCKVGEAYGEEHKKFETRVSYQLEPMGNVTKLTVIQDCWQEGNPAYENTKSGWPLMLSSMKSLVETGKPLDFTAQQHA